jgi:DNA-directed RNA polymerase specialized sigma24 family protein
VNLVPRTTIRHAYGTLTQREYEIWYAHHVDGHSTRHIAAAIHRDRSTIRETLTRAERKLNA